MSGSDLTFADIPVGVYDLMVHVDGRGYAQLNENSVYTI